MRKKLVESLSFYLVLGTFLGSLGVTSVYAGGPATLQGKVLDAQGAPLGGVQVVITTAESAVPLKAKTRKRGTFAIRIPDSSWQYTLECRLEGYADHIEKIGPTSRDPIFIEVPMAPAQTPESTRVAEMRPTPPSDESQMREQRQAAILVFNEGVTALQVEDLATARQKFVEASELDPEFPEAYRLVGRYRSEGGTVTVDVRLSKGKEKVARFEVRGTDNALPERIVAEAVRRIR